MSDIHKDYLISVFIYGTLILIAVNDRKAWITTGYDLEGAIPDVITNKIVQAKMIPYFKSGQYSQGIKEGSVAVHRKSSPLQVLFTIDGVDTGMEQDLAEPGGFSGGFGGFGGGMTGGGGGGCW